MGKHCLRWNRFLKKQSCDNSQQYSSLKVFHDMQIDRITEKEALERNQGDSKLAK